MRTYEDVMGFVNGQNLISSWTSFTNRLNKCSAWYTDVIKVMNKNTGEVCEVTFLKSYQTVVGVYFREENTYYMLGYWSATTVQHNWKYYRKLKMAYEAKMVHYKQLREVA